MHAHTLALASVRFMFTSSNSLDFSVRVIWRGISLQNLSFSALEFERGNQKFKSNCQTVKRQFKPISKTKNKSEIDSLVKSSKTPSEAF